jgi:hypothetical protein
MNNNNAGYDVGDVAELPVAITNAAFEAVNPDALTFTLANPDATEVEYVFGTDSELVQLATGSYYVRYPITQSGLHRYRFTGTGDNAGVVQGQFYARPLTF